MPTLNDPLMIVTDLDGSLLDHHTYSWQPAQPWLDRLNEQQIPVVICSSKTAAEILPLQRQLGLTGAPYIAENGAIIHWEGFKDALAQTTQKGYTEICQTLNALRDRYHFKFTGFADVTEQEVADRTGLTLHNASLARMREGSESLIWRDTEQQFTAFKQALAAEQLGLLQGGRFWSVTNQGAGKGAALDFLLSHYPNPSGQHWLTVGLGDGPNDAPMLDKVDFAVIIKGYSKTPVTLQREDNEHVFHSAYFGPEGWSEGLTHFLNQG
jgi:mannosyl-3-phosphoglycerate phosphatase